MMSNTKRPSRNPDETDRGVFAVSRGFLYNEQFKDEVFTEREAFLWMISSAAWRERTCDGQRGAIQLQRGEFYASIRFMAVAWQWDKAKVARYIKKLILKEMLCTENRDGEIVYLLPNYNKFQRVSLPDRDTTDTRPRHDRDKLEDIELSPTSEGKPSSVVVGSGEPTEIPAKRKKNSYDSDFEDFWRGYPRDENMSKKEASDVWKRLPDIEKEKAVQALPLFIQYCRENPTYRPIHACRFLSKRRADGFIEGSNTQQAQPRTEADDERRRQLAEKWSSPDAERKLEELRRQQVGIQGGGVARQLPANGVELYPGKEKTDRVRSVRVGNADDAELEILGGVFSQQVPAHAMGDG